MRDGSSFLIEEISDVAGLTPKPRSKSRHVGLCESKPVTCVMAKTKTRSKKSSRGVTRCSRSADPASITRSLSSLARA